MPIKLKVVSDGTPKNTRVVDQDGNTLNNVTDISWSCGANSQTSTLTLHLIGVPVEIDGTWREVERHYVPSESITR